MDISGLNFADPPEPAIMPRPDMGGLEPWRWCWREGVSHLLSDQALLALRQGLAENTDRIVQQVTTIPDCDVPGEESESQCLAACPIGYAGWVGEGLATVGQAEEFFFELALKLDERLGDFAAVRHFTAWFDSQPREVVFAELLAEVDRTLQLRGLTPAV